MQAASTDSVVTAPVLVMALMTVGCCLHYRAVSDQMVQESRALTPWCAVEADDEAAPTASKPEAATAIAVAHP